MSNLLDESRLKTLSRSIRTQIPPDSNRGDDQIAHFLHLLDDVFHTSSAPSLTASHRVAAWNVLCSLIDQALNSGNEQLKQALWSHDTWERSLRLYLGHAQIARPKSARQLLGTLTNALRSHPSENSAQVKAATAQQLTIHLSNFDDPPGAKASIQLLTNLLQKEVLSVNDIITTSGSQRFDGGQPNFHVQQLLHVLFRWLGKGDFGSTVATNVATILDQIQLGSQKGTAVGSTGPVSIWQEPLQAAFDQGAFEQSDLRAHLFPALFKRNSKDLLEFLVAQGLENPLTGDRQCQTKSLDHEYSDLFYAALQSGKELGLIQESESESYCYESGTLFIPLRLIRDFTCRSSRSARLAGLTLLLTSPSATRPMSRTALSIIKEAITIFFADVDADFRSDIFSAFQRLLDRMKSVTVSLARQKDHPQAGKDATMKLAFHKEFLQWACRFLPWELRPSASYQRHISALKCLSILARSGLDPSVPEISWSKTPHAEIKWPFTMTVVTSDVERLLLDLLLDPFDDVRQIASAILSYSAREAVNATKASSPFYFHALERAEDIMFLTGRADHADGVAHLHSLCYRKSDEAENQVLSALMSKLDVLIQSAQSSLADAVEKFPIHGVLTSVRYVLSLQEGGNKSSMNITLYDHLVSIWRIVKPILCNDAPEGYLPDELEDSPDSAKDTLSYCWRALKESSLLLGALVSSLKLSHEDDSVLLAKLTQLCFTQLAELRHRGAFSTVARTWTLCCTRTKLLQNSARTSDLDGHYSNVLNMLRDNVTINTRRSAGIPSLVCGLLIGDSSGALVDQAFTDLEKISRQDVDAASVEEGSLPQVHAMNCLKDILKNSQLGEQSERYISTALQLAADALRSDAWAIRNCGLMLFRAVIDRLLGTSDAHFDDEFEAPKRISAETQPELLDVILSLIRQPAQDSTTRYEGVFPALQLLQYTRIPDARISETRAAVEALIGSPSWHVRDKASRAYASLRTLSDVSEDLHRLARNITSRENGLHGALLTSKYILVRQRHSFQVARKGSSQIPENEQIRGDILRMAPAASPLFHRTRSALVQATCLDVLRECSALLSCVEQKDFSLRAHDDLIACLHEDSPLADEKLVLILDTDSAVLRQAYARLVAQHVSGQQLTDETRLSAYSRVLSTFARQDEDAVSYFLQALQSARISGGSPSSAMVAKLCIDLIQSSVGVGLRCEAQKTLLLLPTSDLSSDRLDEARSRQVLEDGTSNQRYVDQWLQLQTLQLNSKVNSNMDTSLNRDIAAWAENCAQAIEGNGIYTREAAAEALSRVHGLWGRLVRDAVLQTPFLQLCMAVYDLLNDDDEDIRQLAATVTTGILAAADKARHKTLFEPIIASQKLLNFCLNGWPASPELAATAFARAFDISEESLPRSVRDQLAALTAQNDTALFAEEKQNLYIDEAREVRVWSQVLTRIKFSALPSTLIEVLTEWTMEGLTSLAEYAQQNVDGPLGWSTKPNVFVLGLRVAYAAEVLLKLKSTRVDVDVEPQTLRSGLVRCMSSFAPDKGNVNCLWVREFERVLTASMAESYERVTAKADAIYESVGRP